MTSPSVAPTSASATPAHTTLDPLCAAIRRMLNRSGNSLLTAVEPLSESEFFEGGANGISAAWTVGHLACVFDLFTSWIHGGAPALPKEVHNVFNSLEVKEAGGPTKAKNTADSGLSKSAIVRMLRLAQIAALKLLAETGEAGWDTPPPGPHPDNLQTVGEIWEHLAVHTYWHMGELCGSLPRFYGTYTLNILPHFFYFLPGDEQ